MAFTVLIRRESSIATKPSNILLDKDGNPYLMDFGIARTTKISDKSLTKTGQILGNPQYMSPEQIQGIKKDIDTRTDIYSLEVILYQIVVGNLPFSDDSVMGLIVKVLNQEMLEPRQVNPKITKPLEDIILKAMAFDKKNRYSTAQDLAKVFANFWKKARL